MVIIGDGDYGVVDCVDVVVVVFVYVYYYVDLVVCGCLCDFVDFGIGDFDG